MVCTTCKLDKPEADYYTGRKQCKLCRRASANAAHHSNIEGARKSWRDRSRQVRAVLRKEFIVAYGGKCTCCDETEEAFLTMEHINGGGTKHRKAVGHDSIKIVREIKRQGWPKDKYTLLCMNCNHARAIRGICPHQIRGVSLVGAA